MMSLIDREVRNLVGVSKAFFSLIDLKKHMPNYREMILKHEEDVNCLHGALYEAVKHRDKSTTLRETWIRAAAAYRNHHSSIDEWIEKIRLTKISDWEDARSFIFQYLEIDPIYNNSGYAKEIMVQKIKACDLTENEKEILRTLIIKRVQNLAWRDFRRFCQLIPRIQNAGFAQELRFYTQVKDKDVARRARFAVQYLSNKKTRLN